MPVTRRAAAFCARWSGAIVDFGSCTYCWLCVIVLLLMKLLNVLTFLILIVTVLSNRQCHNHDDWRKDARLSELSYAVLYTRVAHSNALSSSYSVYMLHECVSVCFMLTRASLFRSWFLCVFVYFLLVAVWLSLSVQSTACKVLSQNDLWCVECDVKSYWLIFVHRPSLLCSFIPNLTLAWVDSLYYYYDDDDVYLFNRHSINHSRWQ